MVRACIDVVGMIECPQRLLIQAVNFEFERVGIPRTQRLHARIAFSIADHAMNVG